MTTNVIDSPELRAEAVRAQRHTDELAAVEAAREPIRPHYAKAKSRLPLIDDAIAKRHRPMLARLDAVAATAGLALPADAQQWKTELARLCDGMPQQVRNGLQAFEALTARALVDPRTPAGELIGGIKTLLQGSDGALREMEKLWLNLQEFLTRWPVR